MGAKVVFLRGEQGTAAAAVPTRVLVPGEALVRDGATTRVWVVESGKLASREVVLGREQGDRFEVERGLSGGESVVLAPSGSLQSGAKVRIRTSS
jgi:hypothetical protein